MVSHQPWSCLWSLFYPNLDPYQAVQVLQSMVQTEAHSPARTNLAKSLRELSNSQTLQGLLSLHCDLTRSRTEMFSLPHESMDIYGHIWLSKDIYGYLRTLFTLVWPVVWLFALHGSHSWRQPWSGFHPNEKSCRVPLLLVAATRSISATVPRGQSWLQEIPVENHVWVSILFHLFPVPFCWMI